MKAIADLTRQVIEEGPPAALDGLMQMRSLEGHVAIVTGASSGIGLAIAERFAAHGARVILAARREAEGRAAAARIGPAATFQPADVTQEADVAGLVALADARFGRLDCLVNNAGTPGRMGPIGEADAAEFDAAFAVHVRGPMLGMKHAAPLMTAQSSGSIINIASVSGSRAGFSAHSYSCAKAALIHLTRSVAAELGGHGIRVNSLSPGPILTGIFAKAGRQPAPDADAKAAALRHVFEALLPAVQPIPRMDLPQDVADVAVFLASEAGRFVTGQDIAVDGGMTTGRPFAVGLADRDRIAAAVSAA